jgi:hypothetical protein
MAGCLLRVFISSMVDSLSKPQFQRQLATSFKNHGGDSLIFGAKRSYEALSEQLYTYFICNIPALCLLVIIIPPLLPCLLREATPFADARAILIEKEGQWHARQREKGGNC